MRDASRREGFQGGSQLQVHQQWPATARWEAISPPATIHPECTCCIFKAADIAEPLRKTAARQLTHLGMDLQGEWLGVVACLPSLVECLLAHELVNTKMQCQLPYKCSLHLGCCVTVAGDLEDMASGDFVCPKQPAKIVGDQPFHHQHHSQATIAVVPSKMRLLLRIAHLLRRLLPDCGPEALVAAPRWDSWQAIRSSVRCLPLQPEAV
mmetsp:Transcript_17515/g.61214  ORF Transcript_17515/g.61214 Transcript_17515/m.61214 type:complete len:209 (+) Transcript_17515:756-1382(+)